MKDDGSKDASPAVPTIATRLSSREQVGYIVSFLIYTIIAAVLPLLVLHWYFGNFHSEGIPVAVIAAVVLVCAAISLGFILSRVNRQVWRLTEKELITGLAGQTRFPLDSIEKIIVGLPKQM